jgi:hypothetical protein
MTLHLIGERGQSETETSGENQTGLPPCEFKLQTEKGMALYRRLERQPSDTAQLNSAVHLRVSRYALAADTVHDHHA